MTAILRLALPAATIGSIMSVAQRDTESSFDMLDGYALFTAHGNSQGLVRYNGTLQSTRLVLQDLVNKNLSGLRRNGISIIYTLSCYGGLQGTYTYRGITITSLHDVCTAIKVSAYKEGYITFLPSAATSVSVVTLIKLVKPTVCINATHMSMVSTSHVVVAVYRISIIARPPP